MKGTSSEGRSPWKVKKASRVGGIVIPKGAILVNQGLRKVKLEEDYIPDRKPKLPASMETENDVNSMATSTDGTNADGENFTEEFTVTKVEADDPMSSPYRPQIEEDANSCPRSCREEIESLRCTVNQLSLQVDKQNQVIRELKSGLRNAVISLMTCCKDEDEDDGHRQRTTDSQSQAETSRSVGEDSLPIEIPSGSPYVQSGDTQGNSEEEGDHSSENVEFIGDDGTGSVDETGGHNPDASSNLSCAALESSSTCANLQSTQNDNIGDGKDNQEDHQGNEEEDLDRNGDSSQVLPSSSNRKKEEDDDNPRGNAIKQRRLPRKIDRIRSKMRNSKGRESFQCSKCARSFEFEIMMQDHQRRVHSKVKPSQSECNLCRKVFSDSSHLRRHVQCVHEGLRFKCEYCPREFTGVQNVRYHEDTVHKGVTQTHPCKVCGKNLATLSGLQKHMKKIHEMSWSKASIATQKKRVGRLRKKKGRPEV